ELVGEQKGASAMGLIPAPADIFSVIQPVLPEAVQPNQSEVLPPAPIFIGGRDPPRRLPVKLQRGFVKVHLSPISELTGLNEPTIMGNRFLEHLPALIEPTEQRNPLHLLWHRCERRGQRREGPG